VTTAAPAARPADTSHPPALQPRPAESQQSSPRAEASAGLSNAQPPAKPVAAAGSAAPVQAPVPVVHPAARSPLLAPRDRRRLWIGVGAIVIIGIVAVVLAVLPMILGRGGTHEATPDLNPVPSTDDIPPADIDGPAEPEAPAASGTVQVTSVPDGAEILVDSEPAGQTPGQLSLKPGEHTLIVAAPSYEAWTQQLRVVDGSQQTVDAKLVPLPPLETLEIGPVQIGRDPYLDPAGTIRLGSLTDRFTVADEVNAIVYLRPKSYGIRDLTFTAITRWQRPGGAGPLEVQGAQEVSRDWEETFVRACAPATAIDPRGSNTPLNLEILIEGEVVATFTFRIGPGNRAAAPQRSCNPGTMPSRMAVAVPSSDAAY
jgi:hypothetical protein